MEVKRTGEGLHIELRHPLLASVDVNLPGWTFVEEDDGVHAYRDGPLVCTVRVREQLLFGLDVEISNGGPAPAEVTSPLVRLHSRRPQLAWLGGATGRVLLPSAGGGGVFRQWRGVCGGSRTGEIELFGPASWVQPGLSIGSGWRLELGLGGELPPDPEWAPDRWFAPRDEEITLFAPDAALKARGVMVGEMDEFTTLLGEPGVHDIQLGDARGTTLFQVGWYEPLEWIVAWARSRTTDPGLRAWLTVASAPGARLTPGDVDELDVLLAEALETNSPWAVLAALRAAATSDLPVRGEAEAAARRLLTADPEAELGPLLWTAGVVLTDAAAVPDDSAAAQWWRILTRDDEDLRQQVLAYVGHGRFTTKPPSHGARGVAMACLWLATREEHDGQLEVARAVANTTARLLAINSGSPEPREVAWLLLANSFSAQI